jgi:hypothetical protein
MVFFAGGQKKLSAPDLGPGAVAAAEAGQLDLRVHGGLVPHSHKLSVGPAWAARPRGGSHQGNIR